MKFLLLFCCNFLYLSGFAQIEKFKGKWITPDHEIFIISDTVSSKNKISNSKDVDFPYTLSISDDSLIFQAAVYNMDGRVPDLYVYKAILVNDSFLTIKPVTTSAKFWFPDKDTIFLIKQQYTTQPIKFEKLIFHTGHCFGLCPLIDLEIDSTKKVYLEALVYKDGEKFGEVDSSHTGTFSGILSDSFYTRLTHLLQTCYLNTLEFKEAKCCDNPLVTLIIYYDQKRKYLQSMFPPVIAEEIIWFLNGLTEKMQLSRITRTKKLEE